MRPAPPPVLLLLLLGLAAGLPGCARSTPGSHVTILERQKVGEVVRPTKTEEEQRADAVCKHVWVQVGTHFSDRLEEGPGGAGLCVIAQCPRCGEMRHDCTRRFRGGRK